MDVSTVFLSVSARDFETQIGWWSRMIGRPHDRVPMPSCREWDLAEGVLFQVLDNPDAATPADISLMIADLASERERLAGVGIALPEPVRVEGFDALWLCHFTDPEGNTVNLLSAG